MDKLTSQIVTNTQNEGYEIREVTHQGRKHIVVPVVMMVEGVHSGSGGPLLHMADELGRFPESWNGIPVVINHPSINGIYVSANSPDIIDGPSTVGRVYNSQMNGNRLMAEAWLDTEKLSAASIAALNAIQSNDPLDVSVGVYTDQEQVEGDWQGTTYTSIARNHRPDHLALLPGGTGACSWNDGCGIRVNNKKGGKDDMQVNDEMLKAMKLLSNSGFSVNELNLNEDGYTVKMDQVRAKINSLDTKDNYAYMEELFDNYVIYSQRNVNEGGYKLYRQDYRIVEDQVEFISDPVEVKKKIDVEYTPVVTTMQRGKVNINKKEVNKMDTNEKLPCGHCMEKVIALINNANTKFTAADREWLLTQEEGTLDKLFPVDVPEKKIDVNTKEVTKLTSEEVLQALSAEDRAAMDYGKRQLAARRQQMISGIQANTSKELWPDEALTVMSEDILEKIYKSVKKEPLVDYSLNGNPQDLHVNKSAEEPLMFNTAE